jgi:carboxypeptidase C (cathepsin A)
MRRLLGGLLLLAAALLQPVTLAQTAAPPAPPATPKAAAPAAAAVTRHALAIGGERIAYTATAGFIPLTDESGKVQASIFYVAYVKDDADPQRRPVTFAFNGGPGASSMWLHLGVGPKRVPLPEDGTRLPAATRLADNEASWLPFTDLVFIDPVGTGYSRAGEGVDEHQFYEVVRDVQAAASFVRRWLERNQRWLSPKFIAGESYGTTRAAALVNRLQEAAGVNVNGVMLVSSVLDFQTIAFQPPNDLAFALALPSYAATLWYHRKLPGDVDAQVREAAQWALSEYLVALGKGDALSGAERDRIVVQLVRYTGLPKSEILRNHLRIGPGLFGKHVLQPATRYVGRFDARVTAAQSMAGPDRGEFDPSFFLVTGPLVEGLNAYLRSELQFSSDLRYEYLSREANRSWKWNVNNAQGFLYVADELSEAMGRDPRLKVFGAAGYYDLATPWLAQKYSFDHMELDESLRGNLTFAAYPSGHQIYTDPASALKLQADVRRFVRCAAEQVCE